MKLLTPIAMTLILATSHVFAEPGKGGPKSKPKKPTFVELDINGDGDISFSEFSQFAETKMLDDNRMLKRLDTDENGSISVAEFDVLAEKHAEHAAEKGHQPPSFSDIDSNNDDVLTVREIVDHRLSSQHHADKFNAMDANNNGVISGQEFEEFTPAHKRKRKGKNPKAMFTKLDTDQNGEISSAELTKKFDDEERVEKFLKRFDINNDTSVNRKEFLEVINLPRS